MRGADVHYRVPIKSATRGAADLAPIPLMEARSERDTATPEAVTRFIASLKAALGEQVSDVRASERLTESAVCLVAPETGMDRQLERLLARAGGSGRRPSRCSKSIHTTNSSRLWRT